MNKVRMRPFGKSGRQVSEIGLGCGGYWGYPVFPEADARAILETAIERGVSFIDTGPNYSNGNAEVRMGRILQGRWGDLLVGTKVGSRLLPNGKTVKDFTPAGMQASLEQSLKRFGTDHVPLVQMHSPSMADVRREETLATMVSWKQKGLVSYIGASTGGSIAREVAGAGVFDCLMVTYSMMHARENAEAIETAARAGMAVFAKSPLAQAYYTKSFLRPSSLSQLWYIAKALKSGLGPLSRGRRFAFLNDVEGWSATGLALKYVLENSHLTAAVIGTTKVRHLVENLEISNREAIPAAVRARIEATS